MICNSMKRILKYVLLGLAALILLWLVLGFCIPKWSIKLTEYQIASSKLTTPLRIVQLSDLHNADFGEKLPQLVAEQEPDLILFVGDLVDMDRSDRDHALVTLSSLAEIAPVYVSMGNHDVVHESNYGIDLKAAFEATGATVLDSAYEDITVKGQGIRIGGIYGYCLPAKYYEAREPESDFLYTFQDTSDYTLLLTHMPVCWLINGSLEYWDVDCVLSGHAHGGQVILPFIGGLYAPDQGWFPGECSGHFETDNKHLFVTTGLGGTTPVPRFWNRPEIVVLEIESLNK